MSEFVTLGSNARWTDPTPSWPERPAWQADAACAGVSTDLFFTDASGESSAEALAVCATCPVRVECLDFALANNEMVGVWGGTTPRQRLRLRRVRHRVTPAIRARRAEVARLRAEGLSQSDIAARLGIGQATVSIDLQATS